MVQCVAVTSSAHQCHNSAKYGEFCGLHRTDKITCQGITKCGERCRKVVKRGQFCNTHMFPEQPDHEWAELVLYKPDVNWPDMRNVLHHIAKQRSGKDLGSLMRVQDRHFKPSENLWGMLNIPTTPEQDIYRSNFHIIVKMQTFFVNYYLDFSDEHWQNIIYELVKKTENIKWLNEYHLLFRKKFDSSFREEIKKKYIETVLTRSPFGKDITKKIMNFM